LGSPEPDTAEPAPLVLGLDDCKAECQRQEACDGFVMHPAAHLCWPCSNVVPDECATSTIFELWVRPARASMGGGEGGDESRMEAHAHTPEPTARSGHEPARVPAVTTWWTRHESLNCFVGSGSDKFPDGSDGSEPGSRSLADCQAACEARVGCQAITLMTGLRGDAVGPCFLRTQLHLESCLHDSRYDLWQLGTDRARAHKDGPQDSSKGVAEGAVPKTGSPSPVQPPPQDGSCPACVPPSSSPPTVVLPFYERDLCKAQYTARSLALHDTSKALGGVLLLWISTQPSGNYAEGIKAINDSLAGSRKVELLDLSPQVNGNDKEGWYAQQVLKLKIASRVKSEYFVVLDSKNTLLQDVNAQTFLTECRQARLFGTYPWGQLPKLHQEWFHRSAEVLQVDEPDGGEWPASITPMVMHTQTVLDMLKEIGEDPDPSVLCAGPLCDMLEHGATEFTLYLMYAQSKETFGCTHAVFHASDWAHEPAVSMWRGLESNVEEAKNVATGQRFPLMFGAQHGALDSIGDDQRAEVAGYLEKIYSDAGLNGTNKYGEKDILGCVVGSD